MYKTVAKVFGTDNKKPQILIYNLSIVGAAIIAASVTTSVVPRRLYFRIFMFPFRREVNSSLNSAYNEVPVNTERRREEHD